MNYRVEVRQKNTQDQFIHVSKLLGLEKIENIKFFKISCATTDFVNSCKEILYDDIVEDILFENDNYLQQYDYVVERSFLPGVTDNTARSAEDAFSLLGHSAEVNSGNLYLLRGQKSLSEISTELTKYFGNPLIESVKIYTCEEFIAQEKFENTQLNTISMAGNQDIEVVNLDLTSGQLQKLSEDRCLALTVEELCVIREHYLKTKSQRLSLGMPLWPTDVELEILAQTWSEHCKHKIFSAKINYVEIRREGEIKNPLGDRAIDGLYGTYIKQATKDIEQDKSKDWLISVFEDNAGIVRFDKFVDLCIKVETHNSPSALDPYGGALTGILGVNRDILGCGMGARPIANTDVFCLADPLLPKLGLESQLPKGLMNPKQILDGVHLGVEDGGNKSGIPTVNGAMCFDDNYAGKPLVFVGTVGVMPPQNHTKKALVDDHIVIVGGAVGADGIHGATFSSLELNELSPSSAVQIGDPLTQKRVTNFLLKAQEQKLYTSITDNGAGGISSSVGEMAEQTNGATLDLAKCPTKYPGLKPFEIMISESQERMTLAVTDKNLSKLITLAESLGVSATSIGNFNDSGFLKVLYHNETVANMDLHFLHKGLPQMELNARWTGAVTRKPWFKRNSLKADLATVKFSKILTVLLSSPNIASKESLVRRYDHEVQGATNIKPFGGKSLSGPNNAGGIWLAPHGGEQNNGVQISCGLNPRISNIDPYYMAQFAVDEAMRNLVSGGVDPDFVCMLDNFCWPDPVETKRNPDGEYKLAQLVRANIGLYDICLEYGAPLVSGKDSMKNDFRGKSRQGEDLKISVLPTLLVTAMGKYDINFTMDSAFKNVGDHIFLIGGVGHGLAGSEVAELFNVSRATLPTIDTVENFKLYKSLYKGIKCRHINSCHDVSDGGAIIAMIESCFGNGIGFDLESDYSQDDILGALFNEAPGRFIVSVAPSELDSFHENMKEHDVNYVGKTNNLQQIRLKANHHNEVFKVDSLLNIWKGVF